MQGNQNNLDAKYREKYVKSHNPLAREKRMGARANVRGTRLRQKQMDDAQRRTLQERIAKEKNSKKFRDQISRSKREKMSLAQKDVERAKTIAKARERMKSYIHQLESKTATSARQDNAFEKIRTGRASAGMEELAKAGREGAFGNEMAGIDRGLATQSDIITKNKGNGGDEMRKILAANSAPMLTINQGKYALHDEKEQKKGMEKNGKTQQTAFTKDAFLQEEMKKRLYRQAG